MIEYKIMKDESGYLRSCSDCRSEVPLYDFSNDASNIRILCEFCSQIVGRSGTPIDKMMFCGGLNLLFERLKK
jgi:hypothetical protein